MWSIPCLNFSKKEKTIRKISKKFSRKETFIQTFATNRQSDRSGFVVFTNICVMN